MSVANSQCK